MFGNSFNNYNGYGNTMPTGTQPYGYPLPNYGLQPTMPQQSQMGQLGQMQQQPMQQSQQQTAQAINTNKLYVNGVDDVRNRLLPPNSNFIFLDNDKPLLYQKIVDGTGQFEVKTFSIVPFMPQEEKSDPIDLSEYAKNSDLDEIKSEIKTIKDKLFGKIEKVASNETTSQATSKV